jgi:tRNA pseudouridine synthase 10
VKEFVHGDFGRTKPNIGTLLGLEADILELDVEVTFVNYELLDVKFIFL